MPSGGAWALGLSDIVLQRDALCGTVDEFEARRHSELEERSVALPKAQRRGLSNGGLESRQWSHVGSRDNPLFRRLSERQRQELFTHHAGRRADILEANAQDAEVLEDLRESRSRNVGCGCTPTSRNAKRMTVKQLRDGLAARSVPVPPGCAKGDLMQLFRSATADECLCLSPRFLDPADRASACPCAASGVGCHSDVCRCGSACENPNGVYRYDGPSVKTHRAAVLRAVRVAGSSPTGT